MKPKTFKNSGEFTRYIERVTGKPFKAAAKRPYRSEAGPFTKVIRKLHRNLPPWIRTSRILPPVAGQLDQINPGS